MQKVSKIWNDFKIQPEIWFFYGFLLTSTLSIRKVLYFSTIKGDFNEYTGIFFYLSDILLVLALVSWLISKLYNKINVLSIENIKKWYIYVPSLLVFWSFVSIFWSNNQEIAFFRSIKLLEFLLFYFFIIFRFKNCSTWNNFFKIIIFVAVFHSLIGFFQFLFQHSIGIFWLKESFISKDLLGVAKIVVDNEKVIRAYGLFPHPNILGGFLLFSILITIVYFKIYNKVIFVPRGTNIGEKIKKSVNWINALFSFILLIQFVVLFMTFSKSAIIGLILGFIYLCKEFVPRGTNLNIFKRYAKNIVLGILIIIFLLFLLKFDFYSLFIRSLIERNIYLDVSRETISYHPIIGSGIGQFVFNLNNYSKQVFEFWQFQPVHNVFLLVWSELGILGVGFFLWLILKNLFVKNNFLSNCCAHKIEKNEISAFIKAIFIGFLFIMLFDHYLWDIQQGQIMFWMILGLSVVSKMNIDK